MKITKLLLNFAAVSLLLTGCTSNSGGGGSGSKDKTDGVLVYYENGDVKPANLEISGDVVIPSEYEGIKVTRIPDNAFSGCSKMTSITIPDSVSYIGKASFNGCIRLSEMTIPYVGTKSDGKRSEGLLGVLFGNKSYTGGVKVTQFLSDYWSDDVTYYLPSTLKKVNVTNADALAYGAFQGLTMIEEINLNKDILTIEKHAFKKCTSLKEMDISMINDLPKSLFVECSALKSVKLNEQLKTIADYDFEGCSALERINSDEAGTFNLPSTLTSIGYAFNGCIKMKKLITPFAGGLPTGSGDEMNMGYIFDKLDCEGTTSVKQFYGTGAFDHFEWSVPSGLREIVITNASVIGYCAFQNFTMLTSLKINKEAQDNVGNKAFENCVEPEWF